MDVSGKVAVLGGGSFGTVLANLAPQIKSSFFMGKRF